MSGATSSIISVYKTLVNCMSYHDAELQGAPLNDQEILDRVYKVGYIDMFGRVINKQERKDSIVIILIISDDPKVNKSSAIKKIIKQIYPKNNDLPVLVEVVTPEPLGTTSTRTIQQTIVTGARYKFHTYKQFICDFSKHILTPKHSVAPKKEIDEFLENNHMLPTDLPLIYSTDPMAIYYDLQPGMIVRVDRLSETTGQTVAYRLCV